MAEPSTKLPPPDYQEATPYACTTFHYMKDGKEESFKKNCIIIGQILSLKKDYEHKLGDPKSQRWYYKDELMSNTKTFQDYLIDATEDIDIKDIAVNPSIFGCL